MYTSFFSMYWTAVCRTVFLFHSLFYCVCINYKSYGVYVCSGALGFYIGLDICVEFRGVFLLLGVVGSCGEQVYWTVLHWIVFFSEFLCLKGKDTECSSWGRVNQYNLGVLALSLSFIFHALIFTYYCFCMNRVIVWFYILVHCFYAGHSKFM